MVTNFTATEIGDFMFLKLVDPYENIVKVNDVIVTAGVSTPNTVGTLNITNGSTQITGTNTNLNIQPGQQIIVPIYGTSQTNECQIIPSGVNSLNFVKEHPINPGGFGANTMYWSLVSSIYNYLTITINLTTIEGDSIVPWLEALSVGDMIYFEAPNACAYLSGEFSSWTYTNNPQILNIVILNPTGQGTPQTGDPIYMATASPDIIYTTNTEHYTTTNSNVSNGIATLTIDQVIDQNTFTITEPATFGGSGYNFYLMPDGNNHFVYSARWSQEPENSNGGQMSPLMSFTNLTAVDFDPNKPLWIDIKAEVHRLSDGNSITVLSREFALESVEGTITSCPEFCGDCSDSWSSIGCATVVVDCQDELYNPYNLQRPRDTYREITELASNMWGHEVKYFRVEPDQRSRDVILMEYSLYNVMEEGSLKIMVPDNAMPSQEFTFDVFGMGFEDFEVHITKGQFNQAFGLGPSPRSRDYLYFPLMNRMYEVRSVSFADEFNMDMTYWRVMLTKYEERSSSIHTDSTVEQNVDDLVTGIEEVFGEEIQQEYDKVSKPDQYQTVFSPVSDGIRYKIHNSLTIKDTEIRNKWTVVAKNIYDLSTIKDQGIEALIYNRKSELSTSNNLAMTMWFRPSTVDATVLPLINGYGIDKGMKVSTTGTELTIKLNQDTHTFSYDSNLETGVWYGVVINLNNKYNALTANVYRLDPQSNYQNGQQIQNTVTSVLNQTVSNLMPYGWTGDKRWSLMPGKLELTNFRLFSRTIGAEQHFNILQQYVVRDNQYAKIIDNAVPSIQLRRYNQAR